MNEYIILIVCSVASTHLWNASAIFHPLREYIKQYDTNTFIHGLATCCKCNAFWFGAGIGWILGLDIIFSGLLNYLVTLIICKAFPSFWKEDTL